MNGFNFYQIYLDRIYRILGISFDHFPEENDQVPSPSAIYYYTICFMLCIQIDKENDRNWTFYQNSKTSAERRMKFSRFHPESEKFNIPDNPVNPVYDLFYKIESIPFLFSIFEFVFLYLI